jgi:hypothetical protein
MRALTVVACLLVCPMIATAQQSSSRADQIASSFTKHKDRVSVKRGVTREKYKDVRAEPVIKSNVSDYAGHYENSDLDFRIDIQVGANGSIQATGYDAGQEFELEHATIAGALLTATKVYADGRVEPFEGTFMNRTERSSPTDTGVTTFGLGVVLATPFEAAGNTFDKVFYRLR